jgi:hypothetical protein
VENGEPEGRQRVRAAPDEEVRNAPRVRDAAAGLARPELRNVLEDRGRTDAARQRTLWYVGDYLKKDATNCSTRIGAVRLPGSTGR